MKRKLFFSVLVYLGFGLFPLFASPSSGHLTSGSSPSAIEKSRTENEQLPYRNWLRFDKTSGRISFPTRSGFVLLREEEIIAISVNAQGEGLILSYRKNGKNQEVHCQTTLSKVMERLPQFPFLKVSRKSIVNMNQVDQFEGTKRNAYLLLTNGDKVKVSRNKAVQIYDWFTSHSV